jgi:probable phosphoglycerate mutase
MDGVMHPVYVVRHGESEWNALGIMQGQTVHPALTDRGRQQSADAARILQGLLEPGVPVHLSSSDLRRAAQTAQILASSLGADICIDRRLRERGLGRLEGTPRAEATTWLAALAVHESPPGGESLAQVAHRVVSYLLDLDRTVVNVVVTHGEAMLAVDELLDAATSGSGRTVANGEILLVSVDPRILRVAP